MADKMSVEQAFKVLDWFFGNDEELMEVPEGAPIKALATIRAEIERLEKDAGRWRAQEEKRVPGVEYGCHVDLEPGQAPDGCVIDTGEHHLCVYAARHACKEHCEYWKPIAAKGERHEP